MREKRGLGHTKIITTTVQTLRSNNIQVQKGSDNMNFHDTRELPGLPVYFQDKQYPYTCNNDSKMAIIAKNINFLKWVY
jgi:hypothetical protein